MASLITQCCSDETRRAVTTGRCAALLLAWSCGGTRSLAEPESTRVQMGSQVEAAPQIEEPERQALPEIEAEQFDAAVVNGAASATAPDTTGAAWRVIEVPAAGPYPSLVSTPSGWLALSNRALGDTRALSNVQSVLYRSGDGVHWRSVPLDPGHDDLMLSGLAYGAGRYLMLGRRLGVRDVIWTSGDGEHWTETEQPVPSPYTWGRAVFAGGHFFAFGWTLLGVSDTGETWRTVQTSNAQPMAVAYAEGHYLLVGSGPKLASTDGLSWEERRIDCSLPGACISDPSGIIYQGVQYHALHAQGRFFLDQLSSALDGSDWQALPERIPAAYVGQRFLGNLSLTSGLEAWTSDGPLQSLRVVRPARAAVTVAGRLLANVGVLDRDAPLPDEVNVEFDDGLDCVSARCVLVDQRLLLVPPPGTPPLSDRVPRRADGSPLLTDECPVSSMISCADYATRSGCECRPEAPREPGYCSDVSQFRCAGAFSPESAEWQVEELARGGCSCDAVDPDQPPSFGTPCSLDGSSECVAPLQCLRIDSFSGSGGPAPPERAICTSACFQDADCPTWQATGICAGPVHLTCSRGSCQPRSCP